MKMKQIVACAALVAATGISAPAFAGATGNVGVFSDYIFRGITQTGGGAAGQGGLDFSSASGLYAGTWISNLNAGTAAYETDLYGGFAGYLCCQDIFESVFIASSESIYVITSIFDPQVSGHHISLHIL